jgi:exo-1,4-beta-D-glucosaminidase
MMLQKKHGMLLCSLFPLVILVLLETVYPAGSPSQGRPDEIGPKAPQKILLQEGWRMQSSAKIAEPGERLSRPGYAPTDWYPLSGPVTVLAGLVENKVYPDPTVGMNLRHIPGETYRIGKNFSNIEMPMHSPFRVPWWFRTEFRLPPPARDGRIWLHLDGINYRANLWLNGKRVANAKQIAGAYRIHELDVTEAAQPGETNALAIEVFPPHPDDLAITFVDWNPMPPDKNMGLWRGVWISTSGPVAIRHPQVMTWLDLLPTDSTTLSDVAHLTVTAELRNTASRGIGGVLEGWIENIHIRQSVYLQPEEERRVTFAPSGWPELNLAHPRLWWPNGLGTPEMYALKLRFTALPNIAEARQAGEVTEVVSDEQQLPFGINQITSEKTPKGHVLFRVNGRRILIRGAAWTPDILQRHSSDRLEADFQYLRDMNLNAVRLEGKLDDDDFFDLADRMGILVMPGWCCCDHWEKWSRWNEENREIAAASLTDQIRRLRNHPSVLVWLNGSDNPPPAEVEQLYLDIEKQLNWPKPLLSSASGRRAEVSGRSGVKMTGPYDYVPPVYWYLDRKDGGAFGYNTETSAGPAIPAIESLREFLPADRLWPPNEVWDFHSGGGAFKNIRRYAAALEARYGAAGSLEDFIWKAQATNYEGERAMYEAYGRNKYVSTGVIHWMLNNAWPSLIWNLYDYYRRPHAGYFGTKKACEPLHVQYSYDDRSVVVVNEHAQAFAGLRVRAVVYNFDLGEKFSKEITVDVPADASVRVLVLPENRDLTPTYFVRLTMENSQGELVSRNFYWLSTQPDRLDWAGATWYYTPLESATDFRELSSLPPATVEATAHYSSAEYGRLGEGVARVRVTNTGNSLAFLLRLKVTRGKGGEEVLPVLWSENYFELFPGESREVSATYRLKDLNQAEPALEVRGWNVNRGVQ